MNYVLESKFSLNTFAPRFTRRSAAAAKGFFLALLFVLAKAGPAHAQTELGTATMTAVPDIAPGSYDYTIHLTDTGSTAIGTFWYGWIPGEFFLPTPATGVVAPPGWSGSQVTVGNSSIEFVAGSVGVELSPGQSLNFGFVSTDSPATLAGDAAPTYPTTPVGTSWLYSGGPFSDPGARIVVQSVPEPSLAGLLLAGTTGLWVAFRRRTKSASRT